MISLASLIAKIVVVIVLIKVEVVTSGLAGQRRYSKNTKFYVDNSKKPCYSDVNAKRNF